MAAVWCSEIRTSVSRCKVKCRVSSFIKSQMNEQHNVAFSLWGSRRSLRRCVLRGSLTSTSIDVLQFCAIRVCTAEIKWHGLIIILSIILNVRINKNKPHNNSGSSSVYSCSAHDPRHDMQGWMWLLGNIYSVSQNRSTFQSVHHYSIIRQATVTSVIEIQLKHQATNGKTEFYYR